MAEVRVMAPMITTVDEVRSFAEAAHAAALPIVGVIDIETPAAALQADQILAEVDFVSIGTNDLAQYTFAADRQSAEPRHAERSVAAGPLANDRDWDVSGERATASQSESAVRPQPIRCWR